MGWASYSGLLTLLSGNGRRRVGEQSTPPPVFEDAITSRIESIGQQRGGPVPPERDSAVGNRTFHPPRPCPGPYRDTRSLDIHGGGYAPEPPRVYSWPLRTRSCASATLRSIGFDAPVLPFRFRRPVRHGARSGADRILTGGPSSRPARTAAGPATQTNAHASGSIRPSRLAISTRGRAQYPRRLTRPGEATARKTNQDSLLP